MKSAILLAAILFAVSASAHAQAFKCRTKDGRTFFSSSPWCEEEGGPPQSTASKNEPRRGGEVERANGRELCRSEAPRHVQWKDPQSVRIEGVEGGEVVPIQLAGNKVFARRYVVQANAKNSYGAYAGASSIVCHTAEDGNRVLNVVYIPRR